MFCYLLTDMKTDEPYILFVEGKFIDHSKLNESNRSRIKIFRVNPNKNIFKETIKNILKMAFGFYESETLKIRI